MIDILVFDIDGTLTDRHSGEIPGSIDRAIKHLKSHKKTILIATGRPLFEVGNDIKSRLQPDGIVSYNGKLVVDASGKVYVDEPIDPTYLKAVLDEIINLDLDHAVHLRDKTLILKGTSIQKHMLAVTKKASKFVKVQSEPGDEPVYNIMIHTDDETNVAKLHEKFPDLVIEAIIPGFYDLYPAGNSKATGVEAILRRMGISWNRVMAFGDNLNDLDMLKKAFYGIVMEDGHPDLKKQKGLHVTHASGQDGILNALLKFGLIDHDDNRLDWTRFKHRFTSTIVRYTLPISGFLFISTVYDAMRKAWSTTTWTNLALGFILLGYSVYEVIRHDEV